MKANEAPEKIYIQSFNLSKEEAKFDKSKMFFDDVWTEEPESGQENIEYVRTDAFIEKASRWIEENIKKWNENIKVHGFRGMTPLMIIEFKNYMKEE